MRFVFIILLSVLLLVGTAVAALLLVPACALGTPFRLAFLDFCVSAEELDSRRQAELLHDANGDLLREIERLERELAAQQCVAQYPDPEPVLPPVTPAPEPEPTPPPAQAEAPEIDQDAWRRRDLAALDGCWELDSDYSVRNRRTGAVTHFNQWRMCFSESGEGTEQMLATNGVRCNGPVTGRFNNSGRLVISEPGNLPCSNDTYIYKRRLSCALDASGRASCSVRQPEIGTDSTVRLRRSARGR